MKHAVETVREQHHHGYRGSDPRSRIRYVRVFAASRDGLVALFLLPLLVARRSYLTHVSHEHVDVDDGDERRHEPAHGREEIEPVSRGRRLASAGAVHQRHLREVRNVQRVPDRVTGNEVQKDDLPFEAGRVYWSPGQHHLLDGEQEQVPAGDGGLRPEQELAVPDATHAMVDPDDAGAPHGRRSQQNVTDDTYGRVEKRLMLHQRQPWTRPLRPQTRQRRETSEVHHQSADAHKVVQILHTRSLLMSFLDRFE